MTQTTMSKHRRKIL